jgi:hypothetical protein
MLSRVNNSERAKKHRSSEFWLTGVVSAARFIRPPEGGRNGYKNPRDVAGLFRGDGGLVWAVGARGRDTVTMVVSHPPVPPDQFTRSCTPLRLSAYRRATVPATVSRGKQLVGHNLAAVPPMDAAASLFPSAAPVGGPSRNKPCTFNLYTALFAIKKFTKAAHATAMNFASAKPTFASPSISACLIPCSFDVYP